MRAVGAVRAGDTLTCPCVTDCMCLCHDGHLHSDDCDAAGRCSPETSAGWKPGDPHDPTLTGGR